MESDFLSHFLLVVDTGSIAEAARRLDLTAAGVAQQIRTLEKTLDAKLLSRAGRTVRPTEAGHRLIERCRPLLHDIEGLKFHVNQARTNGEIRLGAINTALHSIIPDTMASFAHRYPQVNVSIHFNTSVMLLRALEAGELDAVFCLHPSFALTKDLAWEQLREEPLMVFAPFIWAEREPHELLRNEHLIRYDSTLSGGKQANRYMRQHGIVPRERFELNSLVAIAMMVERRLGVALMPDTSSPLITSLKVVRLKPPGEVEKRRFGVIWQRSSPRKQLIEGMLKVANEILLKADHRF
jgi:DNA-binding transcriptional LysR family regulator